MSLKPDSYYIDKVLKGDTSAFASLVRKYQDMVYGLALKMLKNTEDAEEMAQDSFVKAYNSLNTFRQTSKFSTWLYRITYNGCITLLRKRKFVMRSLDDNGLSDSDEIKIYDLLTEVDKDEQERYVREAVAKLPELEQVLITLYYYEDRKVEEISRITGLSDSNVKVKIHRARKKIYELLGNYFKEEVFSNY